MHIDEAVAAVTNFSEALGHATPDLAFKFKMHSSNEPLNKCFRNEIPAPGAAGKSGVYFITDPEKRILYIGKATSGNLGAEIYAKFSAAVIADRAADVPRFEKSSLARWAGDFALSDLIISGNVLILALAIEPAALSSLVEVYLHTLCQLSSNHGLPPLNKRIG